MVKTDSSSYAEQDSHMLPKFTQKKFYFNLAKKFGASKISAVRPSPGIPCTLLVSNSTLPATAVRCPPFIPTLFLSSRG